MSSETQNHSAATINQQIQQKFSELAQLISLQTYGPDGPPQEITFREIESAGYQVGQLAAQKFATTVNEQHQQHFSTGQPCPGCGQECLPTGTAQRELLTRLGAVILSEVEFHCDACRRSFFPESHGTST